MSPWAAEQVSPFARAATNVSDQLMRMPYMRAMGAQRQAMGQYYQDRGQEQLQAGQEAVARANLLDAQRGEITTGDKALSDYGDSAKALTASATALENARQAGDKNGITAAQSAYDDALASYNGNASRVKNLKVGDAMTALSKAFAQRQILSGSTNQSEIGELLDNAAMVNGASGAKPVAPGVANSVVQKIPAEATAAMESSANIPIDENTRKPYPLVMPPGMGNRMTGLGSRLLAAGVPAGEVSPDVQALTLGTNATVSPNIVTNAPAIPAVHHWLAANEAAKPAVLGTNSFSVVPGGVDQDVVSELTNKYNLAPILAKYGMINTPAAASTSAPASVGTMTGTNAPPPGPSLAGIPSAAVQHLKNNPGLRDQFDEKYGDGAAANVLGQ